MKSSEPALGKLQSRGPNLCFSGLGGDQSGVVQTTQQALEDELFPKSS